MTLQSLPLPGANLVGIKLMTAGDLMDRPVTPQSLKRYFRLESGRKQASFGHICIPSSMVGIHLNTLSDISGPPHGPYQYQFG
jgi:hypothetical protein